jgi:hypothetical protein
MVRIEAGDKIGTYAYGNTATVGSDTALWPLELVSGEALEPQDLGDATATVIAEVSGNWDQTALTLLQSSGNGNRGDYDTLPASQGYALPDTAMDESSFARLAADPLGSLACLATTAESSIPDIYGGLMALGRLAVICQPQDASGTPVKLEVVSTAPGGQPVGTITDADLLAHAQEPVVSVQRAEAPNQVTLQPTPAGDDEVPPIVLNDRASQEALGVIAAEWRIPTQDREALLQSAAGLVAAQFASDQTAMAVVLRVHPGTPGRVGDGVWLELTHPALWTWATGEPGYSGPARVVGRTIEPDTCVTTMRLLLDGIVTAFPLSPSAVVLDFDDPDDPTWIEVPLAYLPHMLLALDNADNEFRLDVYRPGQTETIGNSYTIDAVAEVAGVCRLTVAGSTGIHTLVANSSHLTLPATANANQFQNRFAHADDGSSWG